MRRCERGISMVELTYAIAIGAVAIAGLMSLFVTGNVRFNGINTSYLDLRDVRVLEASIAGIGASSLQGSVYINDVITNELNLPWVQGSSTEPLTGIYHSNTVLAGYDQAKNAYAELRAGTSASFEAVTFFSRDLSAGVLTITPSPFPDGSYSFNVSSSGGSVFVQGATSAYHAGDFIAISGNGENMILKVSSVDANSISFQTMGSFFIEGVVTTMPLQVILPGMQVAKIKPVVLAYSPENKHLALLTPSRAGNLSVMDLVSVELLNLNIRSAGKPLDPAMPFMPLLRQVMLEASITRRALTLGTQKSFTWSVAL